MDLDSLILSCYASATSNDRERIAWDVNQLIFAVPTLANAQVAVLVTNDGESRSLLMLSGTLPIEYKRNQYNIPLNVWISKGYPRFAPLIYVTPTADMMIKPSHKYVDSEGLVYHPYLSGWDPAHSSLHELAHKLQHVFSEEPPVFAKVVQNMPPPKYLDAGQPPPVYPGHAGGKTGLSNLGSSSTMGSMSSMSSSGNNLKPGNLTTYIASGSRPGIDTEADKRRKVTRKLISRMEEFLRDVRGDLEKEFKIQDDLEHGAAQIRNSLESLRSQHREINEAIQNLRRRRADLSKWLAENGANGGRNDDMDGDDELASELVVPEDNHSRQLFGIVAESNAIEDTLFELDRALAQGGVLDLRSFLREVRQLSRQLLLTNALGFKVMEAQQQDRPPPVFSRQQSQNISYPKIN